MIPMPLFHMISGAPDPVAPFSHAVESDGWVFVTGQMPFTGTSIDAPYPDGIEAQTHAVMNNLRTVLEGCGLGLADVLSVRIFLTRFDDDYDAMNAIYASWFEPGPTACTHLRRRDRAREGRAHRDRPRGTTSGGMNRLRAHPPPSRPHR